MSGGVDSSVAAHLLVRQGHDVVGVFMRHGDQSPVACRADGSTVESELPIVEPRLDRKQGCCSESDASDARRVAGQFDIPFYALNLQAEFGQIIDYFVDEYVGGRTPNPCVMCNIWLKFGRLFDYADSVGADFVATGHYARLKDTGSGPPALMRGRDGGKDQSYVLFGIAHDLLRRMLLPVGDYHKREIRVLAESLGLAVADKPDSQEICFVTSDQRHQFVASRRGGLDTSGDVVTTNGKVVGTHAGIERFTIGQRKGLGVAFGEPHFVVRIEAESRRVVVGKKEELARGELTARDVNWLVDRWREPRACTAQIRYNSSATPATVLPLEGGRRIRVAFRDPCHGVAPGQAVVCYERDRLLCGGWIE
jgi:tRNA-specific 2-thiouridylase